tara:strand:+ start:774 stop:1196 length:423 start_codon:yes stop_codon:yes gene_type:complete
MSELKDKVRRLIDKAKESGDVDLLDLAMDLLDQIPVPEVEFPSNETQAEVPRDPVSGGEFRMNAEAKGRRPLEVKKRENLYQDTGEHKDKNNQTPQVELTERRRPVFKKVDQTCQRCNKVVKVNPSFARDFFTCDSCLRR